MTETTTERQPKQTPALKAPPKGRGRLKAGGLLLVLILVCGFAGFRMWYKSKAEVQTDNAFIQSNIHLVSARVPGQVKALYVQDNQMVQQDDVLLELDDADYAAKLALAEARLAMARNETLGEYAQVEAARAAAAQAEAALEQSGLDLRRGQALFSKEVIPREQLERMETSNKMAKARHAEARERLKQARALIGATPAGGVEARVAQRVAELESVRLSLAYARVTAPAAGYVTRRSVEVGNNVQPGQSLLTVVQLEHPWVVANYKEAQLTHVKPGQRVEFTVDAYPGRHFSGTVESLMAGTGAAFSLLPPENATGNYVKVVQRIPVKILIDENTDPERQLRVGMSVVPSIHTGLTLAEVLASINPLGKGESRP